MKKRPETPSISNFTLAGVAALFVVTVGVLGGLFYSLRPKKTAQAPAPGTIVLAVDAPRAINVVASPNMPSDENSPVIRLAMKVEDVAPIVEAKAQLETSVVQEQPAAVEVAAPAREFNSLEEALRTNASLGTPGSMKDGNDLLVPDMKGPSYTAKKAAANGGDAYAGTKPGAAMVKKPEPKKVLPPIPPVPPKTPVPTEPPKPAAPAPAKADPTKPVPLSAAELAKLDFSKAPVYVLKDGRRIRALVLKDDGISLTVRNEVGAAIVFKKTDIKETVK